MKEESQLLGACVVAWPHFTLRRVLFCFVFSQVKFLLTSSEFFSLLIPPNHPHQSSMLTVGQQSEH